MALQNNFFLVIFVSTRLTETSRYVAGYQQQANKNGSVSLAVATVNK